MHDPAVLKQHGLTHENLKSIFTKAENEMAQPVKDLLQRHRDRIANGISRSIQDAPHYAAIDRITSIASRNVPHILARALVEDGKKAADVIKSFEWLKIGDLTSPVVNADGTPVRDERGEAVLQLNPNWDQVFIPFVAAYRNMRLAKLMNDRNTFPRYKYSPPRLTQDSILQTEIMTSRVARMTADMGYAAEDRQAARQLLDYGYAISFPREPWFQQKAILNQDGSQEEVVVREGGAMDHAASHAGVL
jgi:hypothetical protein